MLSLQVDFTDLCGSEVKKDQTSYIDLLLTHVLVIHKRICAYPAENVCFGNYITFIALGQATLHLSVIDIKY